MSTNRQLVMVVGPGRSGTSVLTQVLSQLGYSIPQPVIPADETNPTGFGESAWLVDFHREVMKASEVQNSDARPAAFTDVLATVEANVEYRERATAWLDTCFADVDHVVVKDPRILWFTTLWEQAAAEVGVDTTSVTTLRHPTEVVASKQQWYESKQTTTNQLAAWMNAILYTERATRGHRRGFVEFDTMLTDWVAAVTMLDAQADLPPIRLALTRHYRIADEFVDPTLRRSAATWDDLGLPVHMSDLAERIWHEARLLVSADGPPTPRDAEFDELRAEYSELYGWAEAMTQSTAVATRRAGVREGRRLERTARRSSKTHSTTPDAAPAPDPEADPPADLAETTTPDEAPGAVVAAADQARRISARAGSALQRRLERLRRSRER